MIKKLIWVLFMMSFAVNSYAQNGYTISIEVNGSKGNVLTFSYYTGTYSYITLVDSVRITTDKQIVNFNTKEKKLGGIYRLSFKGTDKANVINIAVDNGAVLKFVMPDSRFGNIRTTSALNKDFIDYQQKPAPVADKKIALIDLQKKYPNSVLALFAMLEHKKLTLLEANKDAYSNYLKGIDLKDRRIHLLPNAYSFLLAYINSNPVKADNYSYAVDVLLKGMTCENANYFFYLDWFFQNMKYYQRYKLEDTYRSVYQKYLNTTACKSKKVKFYESITAEVKKMDDLEIGTRIPDFKMEDSTGVAYDISSICIKNNYTLIVFYDPDCEHCKTMMPKVSDYFKKLESKNIIVQKIAFNVAGEVVSPRNFIKNAKIQDWLNVRPFKGDKKFQVDLKVSSTPTYFLLDKEGAILLKTFNTKEMDALFKGK